MNMNYIKAGVFIFTGVAGLAWILTLPSNNQQTHTKSINEQFFESYPVNGTYAQQDQWVQDQVGKTFNLEVNNPIVSTGYSIAERKEVNPAIRWSTELKIDYRRFCIDIKSPGDVKNLKPNGTYVISGTITYMFRPAPAFRDNFEIYSTEVKATEE